ncbi:MAG TPA: MBL fold metallo-hydrolase [Polyangiaceae bacterium]|nr:MBL fold metallo-hydrolase [Polyangiaceae bacterium]
MSIVNSESGTRIDEVARGIYRISTPVAPNPLLPLGFSFNQLLIAAEAPLLFHTGPRGLFPLVREAVATVLKPEKLRYIGFSHTEGDESGSLGEWLDLAPQAQALCSQVAAMIFANDVRDRPVRAMADGERLDLGGHEVTWFDAPHVPHGWDCGYLAEISTRTLFCGDLFTQAGATNPPVTESDLLGPSEAMRAQMDYFAHGPQTAAAIEKMATFEPRLLGCMHGSCFSGDGRKALLALAGALTAPRKAA